MYLKFFISNFFFAIFICLFILHVLEDYPISQWFDLDIYLIFFVIKDKDWDDSSVVVRKSYPSAADSFWFTFGLVDSLILDFL